MFTGLVTDVGKIIERVNRGDTRFVFSTGYDMTRVSIGASIACSGVCLTVVDKGADWFAVDVSGETLAVTTLDSWKVGHLVNFERSLKLGDEMGGHMVTGHVDTVGVIEKLFSVGDSINMQISVPASFGALIAQKGSVAVDGVSLTVNAVQDLAVKCIIDINIIPHTWQVTAFQQAEKGHNVNIEIDLMARYLARFSHHQKIYQ